MQYGNTKIGGMSFGSTRVGGAKLGNTLVYQSGPAEPEPVFYDHLVFDGTAYINTDIIPPENASIRVLLGNETTKGAQRLFMWGGGNSAVFGAALGNSTNTTYRMFTIYYGSSSYVAASNANSRLAFTYNAYSLYLTPRKWGWSTSGFTYTKGEDLPDNALVLGHSIRYSGNPYTGTMGEFKIYGADAINAIDAHDLNNNYTPVYTLRPCTYLGEAGMWCVETSEFYGNTAGAGALSVSN